ncbi:MAG: trigger factor [Deltaproteobacteria bacterium]|jgi:trigger factor|nr:trigger factor [Deltaproteobacteria bacterium]
MQTSGPDNSSTKKQESVAKIQISVEDISITKKHVSMLFPYSLFSEALDLIISEFSSKYQIKGFRTGKAPRNMVLNTYKKHITDKLINVRIIPMVNDAIRDINLIPVTAPRFTKYEFKDGQPFRCEVAFEIIPPIKLPDLESLKVVYFEPVVTEEYIQKLLKAEARKLATISEAPADYQIQPGDRLSAQVQLFDPSNKPLGETEIGEYDLTEDFSHKLLIDNLIGLKVGQTATIYGVYPQNIVMDQNDRDKCYGTFKVLKIYQFNIPVIDDEMIVDINLPNINTLDDYTKYLKDKISKQLLTRARESLDDQICEQLVANTIIHVPTPLIDEQIDKNIIYYRNQLQKRTNSEVNESLESWLKDPDLRAKFKDPALYTKKMTFIFQHVIDEFKIIVTDAEVAQAMHYDLAEYNDKASKKDDKQFADRDQNHRNAILTDKIYDFLEAKAQVYIHQWDHSPLPKSDFESYFVGQPVDMRSIDSLRPFYENPYTSAQSDPKPESSAESSDDSQTPLYENPYTSTPSDPKPESPAESSDESASGPSPESTPEPSSEIAPESSAEPASEAGPESNDQGDQTSTDGPNPDGSTSGQPD